MLTLFSVPYMCIILSVDIISVLGNVLTNTVAIEF